MDAEYNELVDQIEQIYKDIRQYRINLAETNAKLNVRKADLWLTADGTVDQKKDYIKSKTADLRKEIELTEAEIEFCYNQIEVIQWRM